MADEKKVTDAEVAAKKAKKADNKKAKKAPSKFSPKNIGKGIVRFLDLRGETKKIVWPDAKMVVKSTGVVLATVLILGAGVWILDFATSGAITAVMNAAEETTEVTEVVTESSEDEHDHDHDHDEEETTEETTAE